jgi:outer membrane protein assembly factor BamD (BamD/ComL family)
MNKIQCFSLLLISFLVLPLLSEGQTPEENQKKYLYGKDLFKEGRYQAAAQVFLPLTSEASHNAFSKPASYLYALSSLKGGDTESAKSMCLQILQRYPEWDEKDEVYYLLANAYFEQNKHRLALQFLNKMSSIKRDSENLKQNYFTALNQLDTLKAIQKDYPSDELIATILAKKLASPNATLDEKNRMLLNFLIQEYKLNIPDLSKKINSTMKTSYNIALMLPFLLNEIDPKISRRSNQYVLDLYEGIKIAVDSLRAKGIIINLYTYDTEKELVIVNSIISLPEMKSMDIIIGPVFPAHIPPVTEFCKKNNIINISPFSANSKIIENNEFTFLFQPTLELQAGTAARYASENFRHDSSFVYNYTPPKPKYRNKEVVPVEHKNVIIFYGSELKDSLIAIYHRDSCIANALNVIHFEKITRARVGLLKTILGDTIKLAGSNHVFASTSDEVVAANIISVLEIARQNTPLITRSDWLFFNLISFDQFEKRNVFFIHTDYYDYSNPFYKFFKTTYVNRTKIYPSLQSVQGYELTMYFGQLLNKYGTYFKYGMNEIGFTKGIIFQGFDYRNSFSNKYVPLTRFRDKNLMLVNVKY